MKKIKKALAMMMAATVMVIGAGQTSVEASEEVTQPRIHYDYNIPDFSLEKGEKAFTTRYGYGFDVSNEGLNHNDFDLTFKVEGNKVKLKIGILTMSDYVNGRTASYYRTASVDGAGTTTVNFNNLDQGTYVIKWVNVGSERIDIKNANLNTSY